MNLTASSLRNPAAVLVAVAVVAVFGLIAVPRDALILRSDSICGPGRR